MSGLSRRAAMAVMLSLTSCAGDDDRDARRPATRDLPPLRYGYLPPIPLNVRRLEVDAGFAPPEGEAEIGGASPSRPAETLFAMAGDRLKPAGDAGLALFQVDTASIARRGDTLSGVLAVRLTVKKGDDSGFAEARVVASRTGPIGTPRAAAYDMLKSMMDDMNVELEFQIRDKLRGWIVEAGPSASRPATSGLALPMPPPPPPPR